VVLLSDNDVLKISGPMAWSAVVYAAMSDAEGKEINHTHVQNLQEPVLFGDILVLPLWPSPPTSEIRHQPTGLSTDTVKLHHGEASRM
jgi:hypothetical protein